MFRAVTHDCRGGCTGDIAYDMDDDCNRVGDEFMKAIQPSAASVPWMFGPGNHEQDTAGWYKYTTFLQRFAGQQIAANQSGSLTIRCSPLLTF